MDIYILIRICGDISGLILCWVSVRSFYYAAPAYAGVFAGLCIFEQLAEFVLWIAARRPDIQIIVSNAVSLSELFVYSFIFYKIIYSKIIRGLMLLPMAYIFLRYVLFFIKTGFLVRAPLDLEVYTYFVLLIPSFAYFKEIFAFRQQEELLKSYTFWLVAGTLFYCAASVIFYLGLDYLLLIHVKDSLNEFYLFSGIIFIITNSLYIKSFLCLRKGSYR